MITEDIKKYLEKHGSIDELEAAVHFGCLHMRQEISRLRKAGMVFEHEKVSRRVKTISSGSFTKQVSRYRLVKDLKVMSRVKQFAEHGQYNLEFTLGNSEASLHLGPKDKATKLAASLRELANKIEEINREER